MPFRLVVRLAWPAAMLALPSTTAPSWKLTLPVGLAPPLMVAVSVTLAPSVAGLGVAVRLVLVLAALTTCAPAAELLGALPVSPP